jgi:ADP-heptose:LPS heptosyltransferase
MPEADVCDTMAACHDWAAIFEPWGIGDLCIALHLARRLKQSGFRVSLICDPIWVSWLQGSMEIDQVIAFHAPWTEKTAKYDWHKYHLSGFLTSRRLVRDLSPCFICELRGDIRNLLLLRLLSGHRVASPLRRSFHNRYERADWMGERLGLKEARPTIAPSRSSQIFCFFGAGWTNRQVPLHKAQELVTRLVARHRSVVVILQPEDPEDDWSQMECSGDPRLRVIKKALEEGIQILQQSGLCISTDSSWLHLAYLHGIPRVGLFAFASHQEWAPPGTQIVLANNAPPKELRYKLNVDSRPLEHLDVGEVIEAVNRIAPDMTCPTPELSSVAATFPGEP